MFFYTDIAAFILRIAIFLLIFSTYPLIHFFVYQMLIKLFFGERKIKKYTKLAFGQAIVVANLSFALFYPNIGSIMSYVGSVCGFVIIYCLPVMVYLAQSHEEVKFELRGQLSKLNNKQNNNINDDSFMSNKS